MTDLSRDIQQRVADGVTALPGMNKEHVHGTLYAIFGFLGGCGDWFLAHIQAINGVMQFIVLGISGIAGLIGLRKLTRK